MTLYNKELRGSRWGGCEFASRIRGKSGLPKDQTCWVIPSASDREDSATEKYRRRKWMVNGGWRLVLLGFPETRQRIKTVDGENYSLLTIHSSLPTVRVQRCGKSAPAVSRGTGSVNPGWKQGRSYGWSFPCSVRDPLEVLGNKLPR